LGRFGEKKMMIGVVSTPRNPDFCARLCNGQVEWGMGYNEH
jgi:hypothetical protein